MKIINVTNLREAVFLQMENNFLLGEFFSCWILLDFR